MAYGTDEVVDSAKGLADQMNELSLEKVGYIPISYHIHCSEYFRPIRNVVIILHHQLTVPSKVR